MTKPGPRRTFEPGIRWWARRTALIEAGVAVAILVTVAMATSGPLGSHPASTGWASQGLPSLTALIDDDTALQRSMPYPPARDINTLREDLAKADRLGPPPGQIPTRAWTVAGSQLHLVLGGLDPGVKPADGEASALGALLTAAGEELQSVAVSLQTQ